MQSIVYTRFVIYTKKIYFTYRYVLRQMKTYSNTLTRESFLVIKPVTKPKWHNADHYTYTRARSAILHPTLSPKSVTRNGKCMYYGEYVTYMYRACGYEMWSCLCYIYVCVLCAEAEDKRWTYEYIALVSDSVRNVVCKHSSCTQYPLWALTKYAYMAYL